jgi:deoxyribose-phosphate aldolase
MMARMIPEKLARHIQYTNVSPEMTRAQVVAHCEACLMHGFDAAMLAPCWAGVAQEILRGSSTHVASAFSFPSGNDTTAMKVAMVNALVADGVLDFDFTANTGFLLSGLEREFFADLKSVAEAARAGGAQTKVIIEFGLLPGKAQRRRAAELAVEAGIDFLKQSSGFGNGVPATPEDVAFLHRVAAGRARVKASGKINSLAKAETLLAAGASLLGTSAAIAIVTNTRAVAY